jgi:methylamine dehydrogenase accessory protein MauD
MIYQILLIVFGMVLPWLLLGLGCWLAYQMVRQNGRIMVNLEIIMTKLGAHCGGQPQAPMPALPVGSAAPDFELPDLAGGRQTLAQFRGRRVLLIFFSPKCPHCIEMVPDIAALAADGRDGGPLPLVISTGDADENRRLIEPHGLQCPVLLQKQMEVATQYQISGTPMGYLLDEQGTIAGAPAVGLEALLTLALPGGATEAEQPGAAANGSPLKGRGKVNRGLETSHLNRSGLKAGTPAPGFCLPRLDSGELSLEEYHGRRLLLVFSDPECGPCDELAPQLERLHRKRPDLAFVMVSRRDAEANRRKVQEQGLTFPVVLQKHWEVSLRYGMFATPIGYLIDEQGIIVKDVAKGVEPILALASGTAVPDNGQIEVSRGA